jgi:hypothetical protein
MNLNPNKQTVRLLARLIDDELAAPAAQFERQRRLAIEQ